MDFSKIKTEFRKEIVREGTVFLDGQLKVATSADSRASGLAGIFTAAATALTAGIVIALFNSSTGNSLDAKLPLMIGGSVSAIFFLSAAVLCIMAIQPVSFWLPGLAPENWDSDVTSGRELDDCLGERAAHIQIQIADNLQTIATNARRFQWGSRLGITAPFVGVVAWLLASASWL
jgi:hypothetical protein